MKRGFKSIIWNKGIVICLCAGLLCGCAGSGAGNGEPGASKTDGGQGTSASGDQETAAGTASGDKTQATEEVTQELSEGERLAQEYYGFIETPMDLNGREIHIVTSVADRYTYAAEKDKTSNETLEIIDAVKSIERDYNCTITFEQLKGKEEVEILVTAKAAGEVYGDIIEFGCSDTYQEKIYSNNIFQPLETEQLDAILKLEENPWLPTTGFGEMFGHQYGVHFKTNNTDDVLRAAILFNKNLAEQYGLGDLYGLVQTKEWTFDKLAELCADIASQSDGSVYPIIYHKESAMIPPFIYANGGTVAENTPDGYRYSALSDNTLEAVNFAADLLNRGYIHPISAKENDECTSTFAKGESVFYFGFYNALKQLTSGNIAMEDSVGLLPYPLGPHGTDYNAVTYTDALFHIWNHVERPEEAAAVLVALANRTSKHDLLETELMYTLQDEESAEMLDMMYRNMLCDYSRVVSTARVTIRQANQAILRQEKTPKEAYESIEQKIQSQFDEVVLTD